MLYEVITEVFMEHPNREGDVQDEEEGPGEVQNVHREHGQKRREAAGCGARDVGVVPLPNYSLLKVEEPHAVGERGRYRGEDHELQGKDDEGHHGFRGGGKPRGGA